MDTDVSEVHTARRRIVDLTDAVRAFSWTHRNGPGNVVIPHPTPFG